MAKTNRRERRRNKKHGDNTNIEAVNNVETTLVENDTTPAEEVALAPLRKVAALATIDHEDEYDTNDIEIRTMLDVRTAQRQGILMGDGYANIISNNEYAVGVRLVKREVRRNTVVYVEFKITDTHLNSSLISLPQADVILACGYCMRGEADTEHKEWKADYNAVVRKLLNSMETVPVNVREILMEFSAKRNRMRPITESDIDPLKDVAYVYAELVKHFNEMKFRPVFLNISDETESLYRIDENMYAAIADEIGMDTQELSQILRKNNLLHIPASAVGHQAKVHIPIPDSGKDLAGDYGIDESNNKQWRYCVKKINVVDMSA